MFQANAVQTDAFQTAVGPAVKSPLYLTGWEHGVASAAGYKAGAVGTGDMAIHSAQTAGVTVISTSGVPRTGGYCLQCAAASAAANATFTYPTAPTVGVIRAYIRLSGTPTAQATVVQLTGAVTGSSGRLLLNTDRTLQAQIGARTALAKSPALVVGQWYRIDLSHTVTATHAIAWQLDGAIQTGESVAITASTITNVILGPLATNGINVLFDDFIMGNVSGDYPYGEGGVHLLRPDMTRAGLYTVRTNADDIAMTPSRSPHESPAFTSILDDVPFPTAVGDFANQVVAATAAGGTPYIDVPLVEPTVAQRDTRYLNGVRIIGAIRSTTTGATDPDLRFVQADTTVANASITQQYAATTIGYKGGMVTPSTGWTSYLLYGTRIRIGGSADVAGNPVWEAVAVEADFGPAPIPGEHWTATITDTVGETDSHSLALELRIIDVVGLTDPVIQVSGYIATAISTLGIVDSSVQNATLARAPPNEALGLIDQLILAPQIVITRSLGLVDSLLVLSTYTSSITDPIGMTTSFIQAVVAAATRSNSLNLADSSQMTNFLTPLAVIDLTDALSTGVERLISVRTTTTRYFT